MRLVHKTFVKLSEDEIKELKDMEGPIFDLVSEFRGACERKGEIEDEALDECEFCGNQLLKAYNDFIYALKVYGNFE